MLPKIKKRLKSFVLEEEGRISKQSVLKIGSVLAMSLLASSHAVLGGCGGCGCGCGSCTSPPPGDGCPPGEGSCGGGCGGCGCTMEMGESAESEGEGGESEGEGGEGSCGC